MKGRVTVDEMLIAMQEVSRFVQKTAFPREVKQLTEASLSNSTMTNKSSSTCNLDPLMGDGFLRVGGCLRHASFEAKARNPIILLKKAHVVDLLVRHYHMRAEHSGGEPVHQNIIHTAIC